MAQGDGAESAEAEDKMGAGASFSLRSLPRAWASARHSRPTSDLGQLISGLGFAGWMVGELRDPAGKALVFSRGCCRVFLGLSNFLPELFQVVNGVQSFAVLLGSDSFRENHPSCTPSAFLLLRRK